MEFGNYYCNIIPLKNWTASSLVK